MARGGCEVGSDNVFPPAFITRVLALARESGVGLDGALRKCWSPRLQPATDRADTQSRMPSWES